MDGTGEKQESLKNTRSRRTLIYKIRKRHFKSLGHIMRKDGLENFTRAGQTEGRVVQVSSENNVS